MKKILPMNFYYLSLMQILRIQESKMEMQLSVLISEQTDAGKLLKYLPKLTYPDYNMKPLQLDYTTMTMYNHTYKNIHVIFEKDDLSNTFGEIISQQQ